MKEISWYLNKNKKSKKKKKIYLFTIVYTKVGKQIYLF